MIRRPVVALGCLSEDFAADFEDYLIRRGYDVTRADEEWELRPLIGSDLDVLVLGLLPEPSGAISVLRQLQSEKMPDVILIQPNADLVDTVLALELGAAHVVDSEPDMRELAARIAGLVARRGKLGQHLVAFERTTIDLRSALVMHRSGEEEQLSAGQIALLRLFLANPRKVLSRDEIIAAAPAENSDAYDRSIDSRIVRLRRKLDTESIVTIRGSGYRFDPPPGWPD
jgi:two-component system OmpR family response regulator